MSQNIDVSTKEIWLTYFNDVLFKKGLITEKEKNKMNNLISQKCQSNK